MDGKQTVSGNTGTGSQALSRPGGPPQAIGVGGGWCSAVDKVPWATEEVTTNYLDTQKSL